MDIEILLWFQSIREALGLNAARAALYLSDAIALIAVLIPFFTYWGIDKRRGQSMLAILAGSLLINQTIKLGAAVYRPWIRDSRVSPPDFAKRSATGYSFPSTHTQVTATAFGDLSDDYIKTNKPRSLLFFSVIVIEALLRMYLGVHTPQDVLIGMLSALILIPVCTFIFEKLAGHRDYEISFAIVYVFITAAAILFALNKTYPMDYADGVLLVDPKIMIRDFMIAAGLSCALVCGGIIEHRTVNFQKAQSLKQSLVRIAAGLLGAAVIYLFTKLTGRVLSLLPNAMLEGLLLGFWAVLVHPWLFTKFLEKRDSGHD